MYTGLQTDDQTVKTAVNGQHAFEAWTASPSPAWRVDVRYDLRLRRAVAVSAAQPPMIFPPPSPWKPRAKVDPTREYVAFTSAFHLKSVLRVPAFIRRAVKIMTQADAASGIVGWSLGGNIFKLEFYTLSVWQDVESLRHFVRNGDHLASLAEFEHDMRRKSIFVYYTVFGRDLPPSWKDALARQRQHDDTR